MSYYEVRMNNGDLFKAAESPDHWHEVRVVEEVKGRKVGNYFLTCAEFTDIRNGKPVWVNTDLISSIREVVDAKDTTVGLIADDQFMEDTKNVAMDIVGSIFGIKKEKIVELPPEEIRIDEKDGEQQ